MILQRWQIRCDGRVVDVVYAIGHLDLPAAIHEKLKLTTGNQVRLQLNPHDLSPTGKGWVCHPDGRQHREFQVVRLGDSTDRLAA